MNTRKGSRPTIKDVARMANVSKMTVSRVINQLPSVNDETRARVLAIIDKVGYTPDPSATRLASRRAASSSWCILASATARRSCPRSRRKFVNSGWMG
jgi:DNA-binding LacI/PurR family transcriptional regulator